MTSHAASHGTFLACTPTTRPRQSREAISEHKTSVTRPVTAVTRRAVTRTPLCVTHRGCALEAVPVNFDPHTHH